MSQNQIISLSEEIGINPPELMRLYFSKNHYQLSEYFLSVLEHFKNSSYRAKSPLLEDFLNVFFQNFFFFFLQEDYVMAPEHAVRFIKCNAVIANLVSVTIFETTDLQLKLLSNRRNNLVKFLSLYSARNNSRINRQIFFDANPSLASLWYIHFFDLYTTATSTPNGLAQFQEHISFIDPRLEARSPVNRLFFGSTYICPEQDRPLKQKLNLLLRERTKLRLEFDESYQNNKIAVFSACWKDSHAVFKNQFRFIESLRNDYEVVFFPLRDSQNTTLFDRVDQSCIDGSIHLETFINEKFRMVYLPDIGMSEQSIVLANLRIAPIQVSCFGHSASSEGADIDYFIAGQEIEDLSICKNNYSERLILLPGMGIIHKPPEYQRCYPAKTRTETVINCSCSAQKCNATILNIWQKIITQTNKPLLFRLFVGTGVLRDSGYLPFCAALQQSLGQGRFEVITHQAYPDYMRLMEEGDLAFDSFHFGGCNTIIDSLYLGKPILSWRGKKWYNRIGPQQLAFLGLSELVADSDDEYISKALQLINDDNYRQHLTEKIESMNLLNSPLFDPTESRHFKKAIDYLMQNHEALKAENSKEPIYIEFI